MCACPVTLTVSDVCVCECPVILTVSDVCESVL